MMKQQMGFSIGKRNVTGLICVGRIEDQAKNRPVFLYGEA